MNGLRRGLRGCAEFSGRESAVVFPNGDNLTEDIHARRRHDTSCSLRVKNWNGV